MSFVTLLLAQDSWMKYSATVATRFGICEVKFQGSQCCTYSEDNLAINIFCTQMVRIT